MIVLILSQNNNYIWFYVVASKIKSLEMRINTRAWFHVILKSQTQNLPVVTSWGFDSLHPH